MVFYLSPLPLSPSLFLPLSPLSLPPSPPLSLSPLSHRLHVYNPKSPVYDPIAPVSSRPSSAASSTNSSSSKTKFVCKKLQILNYLSFRTPPSLPRDDVLLVWEELERGRDTLAEIQLIQLEKQTVGRSDKHPLPRPCKEEYMSSIQWIDVSKINT